MIKSFFTSEGKFISSQHPCGGLENQKELEGSLQTSVLAEVTCHVPKDCSRKPCLGTLTVERKGILLSPTPHQL